MNKIMNIIAKTRRIISEITSGLSYQWKLNDASGTTAVEEISGNNGSVVGNPVWGAGFLNFDGTDDSVNLTNGGVSGSGARSVSFWIKPSPSYSGMRTIYCSGNPVDRQLFVIHTNVGTNDLYLACYNSDFQTANGAITRNVWQHAVVIYDGGTASTSTIRMYINGVYYSTTKLGSSTGSLNTSAINYSIGSDRTAAGRVFNGAIDDVRVYNRGLTAEEVSTLYTNGAK